MAHKELGFELIKDVVARLEDYGQADSPPKIIGRNISTTLSPLSSKAQRAKASSKQQTAMADQADDVESVEEAEQE